MIIRVLSLSNIAKLKNEKTNEEHGSDRRRLEKDAPLNPV